MPKLLAYGAAAVIFLWGLGHLAATRAVVGGFGELTPQNKLIITMEWLAEGLALCFLGALPALVAQAFGLAHPAAALVLRACAAMLLMMAALSAATGARTPIVPIKLCPVVKLAVAVAFLWATFL